MPYVICNENGQYLTYDKKNNLYVTDKFAEVKTWTDITKANNVLTHSKKYKSYGFQVQYAEQKNKQVNPVSFQSELPYTIPDKIEELLIITKQLEDRRLFLVQAIHRIEMEIVDIEHAAEFYILNASQGYKLYKLLHDDRVERRKYKDELEQIRYLQSSVFTNAGIQKAKKSISGMETRQYSARVNKALFGV